MSKSSIALAAAYTAKSRAKQNRVHYLDFLQLKDIRNYYHTATQSKQKCVMQNTIRYIAEPHNYSLFRQYS